MAIMVLVMTAGLILILTTFAVLRSLLRLGGVATALIMALAVVGVYVPVGIMLWPGADVFAMQLVLFLGVTYVLGMIAKYRDEATRRSGKTPARFHWAPASILGFFGLLFVVLSGWVVVAEQGLPPTLGERLLPEPAGYHVASSAFPGTVARDLFRDEGQFDYIRQIQLQRERGWSVEYGWVNGAPEPGTEGRVRLEMRDRQGRSIDGAAVEALFMRPSDEQLDRRIAVRGLGDGLYEGAVILEQPGLWLVMFEIEHGDDFHEVRGRARLEPASR